MKKSKICQLCKNVECNQSVVSKCKEYKKITKFLAKRKKFDSERESLRVSETQFKCKNPQCNKLHNGEYANGLFCSKHCACHYAITINGNSEKLLLHRKSLVENNILNPNKKAPYGTWKCNVCGKIFETRKLLKKHKLENNHCSAQGLIKEDNGLYKCRFCGREFEKYQSAVSHIYQCKSNPNYNENFLKEKHTKQSKRLKERYKNGEIHIPDKTQVSQETKIKLREATLRYLEKTIGCSHRYNKRSIPILEKIGQEHGWTLQHAENGGEFYTGIGFYVDAYDEEKNIVVEFDEIDHYKDPNNNVLKDKDIKRQKEIINHLHCDFYRYNEKTGKLWKVEIPR